MISHRTRVRLVLTVIISPTKCAGRHVLFAESAVRLASQSYLDSQQRPQWRPCPSPSDILNVCEYMKTRKALKRKKNPKTFQPVTFLHISAVRRVTFPIKEHFWVIGKPSFLYLSHTHTHTHIYTRNVATHCVSPVLLSSRKNTNYDTTNPHNVNLLILLKPRLKSSFLDAHSKLRIKVGGSLSLILYQKNELNRPNHGILYQNVSSSGPDWFPIRSWGTIIKRKAGAVQRKLETSYQCFMTVLPHFWLNPL